MTENRGIKVVKIIFLLLSLGVCMYLILGEIYMPAENRVDYEGCQKLSDGWKWLKEDGSKTDVIIPGKNPVDRGTTMVIENTLPDDLEDNTYMCLRSSKQEIRIYIDNVLRQEYSTKDTRPFGKVSAVAFVFTELSANDSGKTIRIEMSTDSSYTGVLHEIIYGEMIEIWEHLFETGGVELLVAIFVLVFGFASIIISIALKLCYKKKIEMEYLGWGIFIAAIWIIANSVFRQMIFPNISAISDIAFFMIMLLPTAFILYLNQVQSERYSKLYFCVSMVNIIDFVVCTLLHVFNIVDFSDTIKVMVTVAGMSIATLGITMIIDLITGRIKEYMLVALGILGVSLSAIVQVIMYFKWTTQFNGSAIAVAMVFVLIISFINTMKDIIGIENEKQEAVLSNQAKGKFLANMSHEIRTPINAILGMDSMILRECEDESIKEYATNIQNASHTLLYLINDILDFSKIESGKMEIISVEYELSSLIHDVATMIMVKAKEKGLDMKVCVNSDIPYKVIGDEIRIRQILINLLTNAVKYTKEGGLTLTVDGTVENEEVKLYFEVKDTGIGIKKEDISKLFERFERIEEERNKNIEGTGLGMNITLQLLKLMGSELKVESVYGEGSTFSFVLIQKIVSNEPIGDFEERIKHLSADYSYNTSFIAPDARLLVVDDNMMNRKVFINLLKESKVKIEEAEGGQECLDLVRNEHFDIIFLDHMMPLMDGIQTLHHMKKFNDYPCKNTPVIALTANAISGAREMYLAEGFDDFLSKPIQTDKLEKMIVHYLPKEKLLPLETNERVSTKNLNAKQNADLEKLPIVDGIDWQYALNNIQSLEVLENTVKNFYITIDSEAASLEKLWLQAKDNEEFLNEYRIKVHTMKSSSAYIGAVMLSGMAKTLEFAARDNKIDVIKYMTPTFLEEWRSFKEKLSMFEDAQDKCDIEDMTLIIANFDKLSNALEEMDIDLADEAMEFLHKFNFKEDISQSIQELSQMVINLETDDAIELIQEIKEKLNS